MTGTFEMGRRLTNCTAAYGGLEVLRRLSISNNLRGQRISLIFSVLNACFEAARCGHLFAIVRPRTEVEGLNCTSRIVPIRSTRWKMQAWSKRYRDL